MRINRQIITDGQKARKQKKGAREQRKRQYLKGWHPRFVIYRLVKDHETNTKTHVWFETIEREITFNKSESLYGVWRYKRFRLPQNAENSGEKRRKL